MSTKSSFSVLYIILIERARMICYDIKERNHSSEFEQIKDSSAAVVEFMGLVPFPERCRMDAQAVHR